jgi:glutamate synthase (NADPH/NADH) small chain
MILRTSSSHDEGCDRQWAIQTKSFLGDEQGNLRAVVLVNIEWAKDATTGRFGFNEIAGTEQEIPCELALLAIGFVSPQHTGMLEALGIDKDERGNVRATEKEYQTNVHKIFTAGDMRRGQSLVVWAMSEGREAARQADRYLMGHSDLEAREDSPLMLHHAHED